MNTQTTLSWLAFGSGVSSPGCLKTLSWELSQPDQCPPNCTARQVSGGCRGTGQPLFGDFNLRSTFSFPSSTASFCPEANGRQSEPTDWLDWKEGGEKKKTCVSLVFVLVFLSKISVIGIHSSVPDWRCCSPLELSPFSELIYSTLGKALDNIINIQIEIKRMKDASCATCVNTFIWDSKNCKTSTLFAA